MKGGGSQSSAMGASLVVSFSPGLELPRINYARNGKPYRYVFAAEVQWSPIPTKVLIPMWLGRARPTTIVSACKAKLGSQTGWPWSEKGGPFGAEGRSESEVRLDGIPWKWWWAIPREAALSDGQRDLGKEVRAVGHPLISLFNTCLLSTSYATAWWQWG